MPRRGSAAIAVVLLALAWFVQTAPPAMAAGPYDCQGNTYATLAGPQSILNGGFEAGWADWVFWSAGTSISTAVVHSGTSSMKVDAVGTESTNTYQALPPLPPVFVAEHWFYLATMGPGGLWGVATMRNWDPSTGAGDNTVTVLVQSSSIRWQSWLVVGVSGVEQTVPFTLSAGSWHSLTAVVDATRGVQCLYADGAQISSAYVDPSLTFLPENIVFGDLSWLGDAGVAYYDDLSILPAEAYGPGPRTTLSVGTPNYTASETWVTSSTPLTLTAVPRNGTTINATMYRIDAASWTDYAATGPFRLLGEGAHLVEWYSDDNTTVREPVRRAAFRVDNTPPTVVSRNYTPSYRVAPGGPLWITNRTLLSLTAADEGVGLGGFERRTWHGGWSPWAPVPVGFLLSGEGRQFVEWRAWDRLGTSVSGNLSYYVDDTPPTTAVLSGPPGDGSQQIGLLATDAGVGVARTRYSLDGGPWTDYSGNLTLGVGEHVIQYSSVDLLGNTEEPKTYRVTVPPPANWKPLVALIFVLVLLGAGAWSSKRAPWAVTGGGPSASKAFLLTVLPFLAAEAATGVVSLATGLLSIPPGIGLGTAVDLGLLVAGLMVALLRVWRARRRADDPRSTTGPPGAA